jgi:cytochrome b involved in lipid metabolism
MSSKIILPVVLAILVLLVGVGVYASFTSLNPLKENKSLSSAVQNQAANKVKPEALNQPNPYVASSSIVAPTKSAEMVKSDPQTPPVETKVTAPVVNTNPAPISKAKVFTASDLAANNSESSCYVSVSKKVYDVTAYIKDHPGGEKNILRGCGLVLDGMKHAGGAFTSDKIQSILAEYDIGELK